MEVGLEEGTSEGKTLEEGTSEGKTSRFDDGTVNGIRLGIDDGLELGFDEGTALAVIDFEHRFVK